MRLLFAGTRITIVLTLLVINISFLAFGQGRKPQIGTMNTACKWRNQICDDGKTPREVCITDGDGNTCTCGDTSWPCPSVEP